MLTVVHESFYLYFLHNDLLARGNGKEGHTQGQGEDLVNLLSRCSIDKIY